MILDGHDPVSIERAAQALAAGELIGLPTETVYGLAADAGSDGAVAKIFSAKGRPSDHPLIVHLASTAEVPAFATQVPDFAQALMDAFWPGPLTLILPRRAEAGAAAAGGQDSIGLRCPSHPVAHALLTACARLGVMGLAAPSANLFGRVSPTTAGHVEGEFGDGLLVLDGGSCQVGIESTIVDCTRGAPVLLRPGGISREQVEAACGRPLRSREDLSSPDPRASGTLEAHYAPRAKVRLMDTPALVVALQLLGTEAPRIGVYARTALAATGASVQMRRMPTDAEATARELFAVLRRFDEDGVQLIWVERPPASADWEGVNDRLQRAAAA